MKLRQRFLAGLLCLMLLIPTPALAAFTDINGHWAAGAIYHAQENSWVSGYENGQFRPQGEVTRVEFLAMANKIFNLEVDASRYKSVYEEIGQGRWYDRVVMDAEAAGLLDIFPAPHFEPNKPITREEVAATLNGYLKLGKTDSDLSQQTSPVAVTFKDSESIGELYRDAVYHLSAEGFLAGYDDGTFRPQNPITRAEAIVLILRVTDNEPVMADPTRVAAVTENGNTYFKDKENDATLKAYQVANNRLELNDSIYYLNDDGSVRTGWIEANGQKYYSEAETGLVRGWHNIDGANYYFSPYDYTMHRGGARATVSGAFYFDNNGKAVSGNFPSGVHGKSIYWAAPTAADIDNSALNGVNAKRLALGEAVANYAAARQGIPFKWFGTDLNDPTGVYCCGAAYAAYHAFGIDIPGPNDTNMYADRGYRMVKDQYLRAPQYGGTYVATNFSQLWPGDLSYSAASPGAYNHVAIFLGMNGGRPMVAHATLADGFVIEPTYIVTNGWGYHYLNTIRLV